MAEDLRPVYTAVNDAVAAERLEEFHDRWGEAYPAISCLQLHGIPSDQVATVYG